MVRLRQLTLCWVIRRVTTADRPVRLVRRVRTRSAAYPVCRHRTPCTSRSCTRTVTSTTRSTIRRRATTRRFTPRRRITGWRRQAATTCWRRCTPASPASLAPTCTGSRTRQSARPATATPNSSRPPTCPLAPFHLNNSNNSRAPIRLSGDLTERFHLKTKKPPNKIKTKTKTKIK